MPKTPENSPKPLLQKLGLKAGMRIAVLGFDRREFMQELEFDTCLKQDTDYDAIVVKISRVEQLRGLTSPRAALTQKGMLWVAYPKGVKEITKTQVMVTGNVQGFTDVKICSFSEIDTALKFVRRLAERS